MYVMRNLSKFLIKFWDYSEEDLRKFKTNKFTKMWRY